MDLGVVWKFCLAQDVTLNVTWLVREKIAHRRLAKVTTQSLLSAGAHTLASGDNPCWVMLRDWDTAPCCGLTLRSGNRPSFWVEWSIAMTMVTKKHNRCPCLNISNDEFRPQETVPTLEISSGILSYLQNFNYCFKKYWYPITLWQLTGVKWIIASLSSSRHRGCIGQHFVLSVDEFEVEKRKV